MEGEFGFEREPRIEGRAELGKLRIFFSTIRTGTTNELVKLLRYQPQRDRAGNLIWLLTSGMAVDLVTNTKREHHDLDIVVMNPGSLDRWEILGTDNVTPGQYWADMKFDPHYLENTVYRTSLTFNGKRYPVETVHPSIIIAQKLSNAFDRNPREKDVSDVVTVIKWWERCHPHQSSWINIVDEAVKALPENQQQITTKRIVEIVPDIFPGNKSHKSL